MDHAEKAKSLFLEGYNCSQAVLLAFCDELGLDRDTALRLASSFGGGMGRLREVCGAVSGMFMVIGLLYGYADPSDRQAKTEHYARVQALAARFRGKYGSIVCRDLLGGSPDSSHVPSERTATYYQKRPCAEQIAYAAALTEQYIAEHER